MRYQTTDIPRLFFSHRSRDTNNKHLRLIQTGQGFSKVFLYPIALYDNSVKPKNVKQKKEQQGRCPGFVPNFLLTFTFIVNAVVVGIIVASTIRAVLRGRKRTQPLSFVLICSCFCCCHDCGRCIYSDVFIIILWRDHIVPISIGSSELPSSLMYFGKRRREC